MDVGRGGSTTGTGWGGAVAPPPFSNASVYTVLTPHLPMYLQTSTKKGELPPDSPVQNLSTSVVCSCRACRPLL